LLAVVVMAMAMMEAVEPLITKEFLLLRLILLLI
jgi:hypothetical protein